MSSDGVARLFPDMELEPSVLMVKDSFTHARLAHRRSDSHHAALVVSKHVLPAADGDQVRNLRISSGPDVHCHAVAVPARAGEVDLDRQARLGTTGMPENAVSRIVTGEDLALSIFQMGTDWDRRGQKVVAEIVGDGDESPYA